MACGLISTDFGMFYLEVKMTLYAILQTMWIVLRARCAPNTRTGTVSWPWEVRTHRAGADRATDCVYSPGKAYTVQGRAVIHLSRTTANRASAKLNASLPRGKPSVHPWLTVNSFNRLENALAFGFWLPAYCYSCWFFCPELFRLWGYNVVLRCTVEVKKV